MATTTTRLATSDYRRLLRLRDGLRTFLKWSEDQAQAVGMTPAQHQLLLAIRGNTGTEPPTIGDVADHLLLHHNSAVGLVDRAEEAGLVRRSIDPHDHRIVRLSLTPSGRRHLESLSAAHLEELRRLATHLRPLWEGLETVS
ncbi:MAG: MarR family winged helix-turn-helix transcriptional regulator [Actinomycetota bacterium]